MVDIEHQMILRAAAEQRQGSDAVITDTQEPNLPRSLPRIFAALSNDGRLALIDELARAEAGPGPDELSISTLAVRAGLSRFAASRHLAILRTAGLVIATRVRQSTVHKLNWPALAQIEDWMYSVLDCEPPGS
ncbi:ArsR/SmtB family transcription factor [Microbacterium rhizomatis]|uniref:Winged helix-turn-helix transcriptional regulator n=1 Tax=Microbacterium rhizomatis TaxID=1631477 RepID=A0A5J5IX40_9MICO|nr:helix-turn-helix domain-containing protein [Microbacterium rhizomatis]KAA9105860.1 winged helix-turn-helix transcriptional regulator [Microbacterium rhizomatis]